MPPDPYPTEDPYAGRCRPNDWVLAMPAQKNLPQLQATQGPCAPIEPQAGSGKPTTIRNPSQGPIKQEGDHYLCEVHLAKEEVGCLSQFFSCTRCRSLRRGTRPIATSTGGFRNIFGYTPLIKEFANTATSEDRKPPEEMFYICARG